MAIPVPPSLGKYPATSSPLYLSLRYALPSELGKWRNIDSIPGEQGYLLPPPKFGLGMATQAVALDEVSMWSANIPLADKARMVVGDTAYYAVASAAAKFGLGDGADYDYITGGASVPKELSALQYKGLKKRAYNFSFQLFAYDAGDSLAISNFVENMHSLCMPRINQSEGSTKVSAPAIFQPRIVDENMNEVNAWLFQPMPCTMLTFNSSGGQYASAENGKPAVMTISMIMAEIESVVFDSGQVKRVSSYFKGGE